MRCSVGTADVGECRAAAGPAARAQFGTRVGVKAEPVEGFALEGGGSPGDIVGSARARPSSAVRTDDIAHR
jgi:hypothetical protein